MSVPVKTYTVLEDVDRLEHLGVPCSFLDNGKCSIYEHRPYMCRALVNMDSTDLLCQHQTGAMSPVPYLNTTRLHMKLVSIAKTDVFADIRDWFPSKIKNFQKKTKS